MAQRVQCADEPEDADHDCPCRDPVSLKATGGTERTAAAIVARNVEPQSAVAAKFYAARGLLNTPALRRPTATMGSDEVAWAISFFGQTSRQNDRGRCRYWKSMGTRLKPCNRDV